MPVGVPTSDTEVVETICSLNWRGLTKDNLVDVAWAYYFFSVQFRENLKIARHLYPEDPHLEELEAEECWTSNLSPWRGVALESERLDHDEFMRRTLALSFVDQERRDRLCARGMEYLEAVRASDAKARALSMASYEGGGLERVFRAILTARDWSDPALEAFRHFLIRHLQLDGHHGALVGHLDGRRETVSLWSMFESLLVDCVPALNSDLQGVEAASRSRAAETRPESGLGTAQVDCPIVLAGTV